MTDDARDFWEIYPIKKDQFTEEQIAEILNFSIVFARTKVQDVILVNGITDEKYSLSDIK